MRMCSPTARVTSRPERWISSASCTPVAEAPTTSTPPCSSWPGLRYCIGVSTAIPGLRAPHAGHRRMRPHGRGDPLRVPLQESNRLGHRAIPVGIVSLVAVAREPAQPVRREQAQRIPALGLPRVRHLTALEDHVVDRALGEAAAHGEAGVPRADDESGGSQFTPQLRLFLVVETETLVGLVMTSYTAERFCDCATSASRSSFEASASISKFTLMSLKPLRTSLSMPRMPWMSIEPSSVALTERSWILRSCAIDATPAVRQPASPASTISTGVAPLSSEAKISGWSVSKVNSVLWLCCWPRP